jgi:hypothetical protein
MDIIQLDILEKALDSRDYGKIDPAIRGVGKTCAECHQEHRLEVWYKYHWKDFETIKIPDPVSNKLLGFIEYMFGLHHSYSAANTYLSEEKAGGKFNKTIEALYDLQKRVEALNVGCRNVHQMTLITTLHSSSYQSFFNLFNFWLGLFKLIACC